ncbi:MAG: hypothetical protein EZS28_042659, partial [Streblomastix strix]
MVNEEERKAIEEFEAQNSYGAGGQSGACGAGMMEIDGKEEDYDYYESQAAIQDRMKS